MTDIRWIQRFDNFEKVLHNLSESVEMAKSKEQQAVAEAEMLKISAIKLFEMAYELAWKLLKDYLEYQGNTDIFGSRDAFRLALKHGLIDDEQWMKMIKSRNLTTHSYDSETANIVYADIESTFLPLFMKLHTTMQRLSQAKQSE